MTAIAHAVDHLLPAVCGCGDDDPARAHAEREDPVALHLRGEAVGCRWQVLDIGRAMVLYLIDEALGMLHPYAEGKGLGL